LELENESQTDPKEHLSAPRSTPGHLDDAPAETSPSPRRQSNAEEQVRHSVASEMKQLHISTPNGQQTTYPEDQIRSLWQRGLLVDSALYWEESMIEWRPLREYFAHARSVAPPEGLPGHGARQPERVALRQRSLPSPVGRAPDEKYAPERSHDVERSPNKGPRGIGGWLLFFCIAQTILGPALGAVEIAYNWTEAQPAFAQFPAVKTAVLFVNWASAAILLYGFIVGCLIWNGAPYGKRIAKEYLVIRFVALIIAEIMTFRLMGDLPRVDALVTSATRDLWQAAIFSVFWWSYFKRSVRVRNTYG
jgi:hypothetical protein